MIRALRVAAATRGSGPRRASPRIGARRSRASPWSTCFGPEFRPGVSVTQWVQGGKASEKNDWGYPAIGKGFTDFLTSAVPEDRERGLATAFRSMGQVEHLITDNTVPDHARDLAHPGDGFEEYLHNKRREIFGSTPRPWPRMPLERIEQNGLRGFWDQGLYTGASPADGLAEGAGIDEYTQANFLAWNRFTPPNKIHIPFFITNPGAALAEADILYFTTVPPTTGVGFELMPYPKLTTRVDELFGSEPPAQQFSSCIALKKGSRNIISDVCWREYALPLMQRAHGTAETVFKLAMPPLRAEVLGMIFPSTDTATTR